jgi:hypothetical protein
LSDSIVIFTCYNENVCVKEVSILKKIALILISISVFFFLAVPIIAKDELPKGLEDKGPITKITFIHYKKDFVKPPHAVKDKTASCYEYLGKGVLWKNLSQDLNVNTTNTDGMDTDFVKSAIESSAQTWEDVANVDLFGNYIDDTSADWNENSYDNKNEISFGDYADDGVIAVTNIWGYFGGPPQTRQIVEFDILFNEHYQWGDGEKYPALMDLQNIATHELGHGWGLDDIYTTSCSAVTMYGYSDYGEVTKRDLEQADITGIFNLYN